MSNWCKCRGKDEKNSAKHRLKLKIGYETYDSVRSTWHKKSNKWIDNDHPSFFDLFILSCRINHDKCSPSDRHDGKNGWNTNEKRDDARNGDTGISSSIWENISWRCHRWHSSNGTYGKGNAYDGKKEFHRLSEEWSNQLNKCPWEKCDQHCNNIPFNDCFPTICLLSIARRKDVEVSSNDDRDDSNNWYSKEKYLWEWFQNSEECSSTCWYGGTFVCDRIHES